MPGKDTISEKNVGEEFFLTPLQLATGVEEGKLTFQIRSFHGNSYKIYNRSEIIAFAQTQVPDEDLKIARENKEFKTNVNNKKSRLEMVVEELEGMDAKKIALREEKKELEQWLVCNDTKFKIKFEKEEAIRHKEQIRLQKEAEKQAKEQQRLRRLAEKQTNEALKFAKANKKLMESALNNSVSAMYYSQPLLYQYHTQENLNNKRGIDSIY